MKLKKYPAGWGTSKIEELGRTFEERRKKLKEPEAAVLFEVLEAVDELNARLVRIEKIFNLTVVDEVSWMPVAKRCSHCGNLTK